MNWLGAHPRVIMDRVCESLGQLRISSPMQMQIARVQRLAAGTGGIERKASWFTVKEPRCGRSKGWLDCGAVKLVASRLSSATCQKVIMIRDYGAIAQGQPFGHDRVCIDRAYHWESIQGSAQIKQTRTFGDRRHAVLDCRPDLISQAVLGRELRR